MTDKLKPCPFCGGRVELVENASHIHWTPPLGLDDVWWFRCTKCYCMFNFSYHQNCDHTKFEHMEYLAKLFNTRKPIDETIERIHKYFAKQANKRANGKKEVSMGLVADILEHNKGVCEIIKAVQENDA